MLGGRTMAYPDRRAGDPGWTEWHDAVGVAMELNVAPQLWCALRDRGCALPEDIAALLRAHHRWNTIRNLAFQHRLAEAVEALNRVGITPLLFKGAAQLVDGTLADAGSRWMADLDVAVPTGRLARTVDVLRDLGYEPAPGKPFVHDLALAQPGGPGPIEVHLELGSPPIPAVLSAAEAWAESSDIAVGTARARMLCPTHQVLHCVLHAAVQDHNQAVAGLPLRHLLTLTSLIQVHGRCVDWALIDARMDGHGLSRALRNHLWLAHRFTGLMLPEGYPDGMRPRFHEARVLANFGLGWPAHLRRNLRLAFARDYLDALYSHGDHPLKLGAARVRHAVRLLHRDGRGVLHAVLKRGN